MTDALTKLWIVGDTGEGFTEYGMSAPDVLADFSAADMIKRLTKVLGGVVKADKGGHRVLVPDHKMLEFHSGASSLRIREEGLVLGTSNEVIERSLL